MNGKRLIVVDMAREERNVLFHEPKNLLKSTAMSYATERYLNTECTLFFKIVPHISYTAHKTPPVSLSRLGNASDDIKMA